jgi:hypothetical protein
MDAIPSFPHRIACDHNRPPDWRWRRAQWLCGHGRYFCRRRDDELTGQALRYLRLLKRSSNNARRTFPSLHSAHQLHESNGSITVHLLGRVLANQSATEISLRTGLDAAVIETYEDLFFDVRAHLGAADWVFAKAIFGGSLKQDSRAVLYKRFGYVGGPALLDAVHSYLIGGENPFLPMSDLSTADARREQRLRLTIAVELLSDDPKNSRIMQRIRLLTAELEQRRPIAQPSAPDSVHRYAELIEKALVEVPLEQDMGAEDLAPETASRQSA